MTVKSRWFIGSLLFAGPVLLWVAYVVWLRANRSIGSQFGGAFGGVEALFSGLAFGALIFAILLQKDELELQRAELRETRAELSGQRQQLEAQARSLTVQAFNSTFFGLLSLLSELADRMQASFGHVHTGRMAFRVAVGEIEGPVAEALRSSGSNPAAVAEGRARDVLLAHSSDFGPFFRLLVQLCHLLADAPQGEVSYASILRSRLTTDEMTLVAYFIRLSDNESATELARLAAKYDLLRHHTPTHTQGLLNHISAT